MTTSLDLNGWLLRDASGRVWVLDGSVSGNQSIKILRNGMPMSLNNDGDVISLVGPENLLVDEFQYVGSSEGVEITTGH